MTLWRGKWKLSSKQSTGAAQAKEGKTTPVALRSSASTAMRSTCSQRSNVRVALSQNGGQRATDLRTTEGHHRRVPLNLDITQGSWRASILEASSTIGGHMDLPQSEIEQIKGRMRRRVIQLPVRYGEHGELKRCPFRKEGVYSLKAQVPYAAGKAAAERQPTRARAVLHLIAACDITPPVVTITVTGVERQDEAWIVKFEKGDWRANSDRPVYLSRDNDFTMIASRQTVRGDPEYAAPFAKDLERARAKALEKREQPHRNGIQAMYAAAHRMAVQKHTMHVQARKRLALIERETAKLATELGVSVEECGTLRESEHVQSQSSVEANDGSRPTDIAPVVSLGSAA